MLRDHETVTIETGDPILDTFLRAVAEGYRRSVASLALVEQPELLPLTMARKLRQAIYRACRAGREARLDAVKSAADTAVAVVTIGGLAAVWFRAEQERELSARLDAVLAPTRRAS